MKKPMHMAPAYFHIQKSEAQNIKRVPGIMKGEVYMSDDFDAPLDDFKEYM